MNPKMYIDIMEAIADFSQIFTDYLSCEDEEVRNNLECIYKGMEELYDYCEEQGE